jgi:DNA-binding CsgD family transcriptional regulator|tara:strand:+ start:439 stop:1134 length:696 start_codon:yes stop_codon:yes gene_type:complete
MTSLTGLEAKQAEHGATLNYQGVPADAKVARQQAELMLRRHTIQEHWLQGRRVSEIAITMDLSIAQVASDLKRIREDLYSENKASLQEHAEQTVAILRKALGHLWDMFAELSYDASDVSNNLKILEQIRKTEETVAKVRGLLTSRVIADVMHHVKMYDFEDTLPPAPQDKQLSIVGETGTIIEHDPVPAEVLKDIQPPPPASPGKESERPDFDDIPSKKSVLLPNGVLIDL